jgi:tetratricopeptide (TPR) repeat protein
MPFNRRLLRELGAQLQRAEDAQAAEELHQFVERVRALYGADSVAPGNLEAVEAHCQTLWRHRDQLRKRLGLGPTPDVERDPPLRTDLLDLAVLWVDLRLRRAKPDEVRAVRREALDVLAEAEGLFGPSAVLYHEQQVHAEALGLTELAQKAARLAATSPPRSAWEHYVLGRSLLRAGELEAAVTELDRSLDLQPRALWPNFARGQCAFRLGRAEEAVPAFTACITLAPENAGFFYNRGLAYAHAGRSDLALRDYDHALRLDPALGPAALNRAMLHCGAQRHALALADLERARASGVDPATVSYNLALVHLAQADREAALASVREALRYNPAHREAGQLQEQLRVER